MRTFASDNYSGVHPEIMTAILTANKDHMPSYGADAVSAEAKELFKKEFGEDCMVYFMGTGTATNTLILKHLTRNWNSVICADCSHITVDECGSYAAVAGITLTYAETVDGKITAKGLEPLLSGRLDVHQSQPKVVSITQNTELGTIYTLEEIKEICEYAHDNGLYVHMDGARIANACVALGVSLKEMTVDCGIDALSFGGTKNGGMCAEAAVFFDPELGRDFGFTRKQGMQLISKMRYVGAQFKALLSNELWKRNAENSNKMAALLAEKAGNIEGVEITRQVEANGVFAIIPKDVEIKMQDFFPFYVWDESTGEVRWMTSWSTTKQDIIDFCDTLSRLMSER